MESLNDWQLGSVDDFPSVAGRLGRQRFIVNNSRSFALGSFAVVLFAFVKLAGNSTNHIWFLPVIAVLVLGIAVNIYSLLVRFRVLGVVCPRCNKRFRTDRRCSKCGFPQHWSAPESSNCCNIAIARFDLNKGEQTAHACDIA